MAGLTCAVYLQQAGIEALVLEAADRVGGRVRTDQVAGFRLDRGFQVLLTAYPETKHLLNYSQLNLRAFRSGALIHHENRWMRMINPLREPQSIFQMLASPVGTLSDKLKIVELIRRVHGLSTHDFFQQSATTTIDYLVDFGFSDEMIVRFFRPFFGGIFLEDALHTSSNFFEFCFKMFYSGDAAVPALGMEQIPLQLAGRLKPEQIRLNTAVDRIAGNQITLASGETVQAGTVVLAVDAAQVARLLNQPDPEEEAFNHTTCTYFAADHSPNRERLLILNTKRASPVHNIAIMSDVAPAYAPEGQTLISVSTQGLEMMDAALLTENIRKDLLEWFGEDVKSWRHLKTYHIPHALPDYGPGSVHLPLQLAENLYQCGDRTAYPSLNAAMQTGREVAERIIMS
ncbi:NAD(P)/FAD-dependent oxidoreductase [Nibrella saemangeumensis]|uniref:NAD(P)/FAD-dependent oxidoreductase n=2 Tax=Nibrella saemangeumensis TaxID=1084526 RepID=A0ABP8N0J9_9BACT